MVSMEMREFRRQVLGKLAPAVAFTAAVGDLCFGNRRQQWRCVGPGDEQLALARVRRVPLAAAAEQITLEQFQFFLELGELGLLLVAGHRRFGQHRFGVRKVLAGGQQFALERGDIRGQRVVVLGSVRAHAQ